MSDARTKIEFLYKEVLGDVHAVLEQMETLKTEFPAAADAMAGKLELLTGNYLAAGKQLADVMIGMSQEIDRQAATAAQQASEAAKLDIRQAAAAAASDAVSQAVGGEVAKVIGQLAAASADLDTKVKEASAKVVKAMSWSAGRLLGVAVLCSLISAGAVLAGANYMHGRGGAVPVAADQDTAKQIEAGRDFLQVLPQLDKPTKDKLIRMIQENRTNQQK